MRVASSVAHYIEERDHRLMRLCNRWPAPRWVRFGATLATRAGDGWAWYALAAILWAFGGPSGPQTVGAATLAAFVGVCLFLQLKRITGRQRPCALEKHCWAKLLPPDQYSFPSGHSMTAFSICVPVSLAYPALSPLLSIVAISIAVSRILLGMHFLSDVVVGSLLGSLLGVASYALFLA